MGEELVALGGMDVVKVFPQVPGLGMLEMVPFLQQRCEEIT
jgi:hypothetical protein